MKLTKRVRLTVALTLLLLAACDSTPGPITPTVITTTTPPTASATLMPTTTAVAPGSPTSAPATVMPTEEPTLLPTSTSQLPTPGSSAQACSPDSNQARKDGLGDPLFPQLGNSGYDALHYTLDLAVDVASNVVSGTSTMRARSAKELAAFNLDFESLGISALTVNGTAASYSHERHETDHYPDGIAESGGDFHRHCCLQGRAK